MLNEPQLQEAVPDFARRVISALTAIGRVDLAKQLEHVHLRHVTYDATVDAGYLYVTESRPLNIAEQSTIRVRHDECVTLDELPGTVVVDVDNLGRVMGIELLGYAELFRRLGSDS